MNIKKWISCLLSAVMMGSTATACHNNKTADSRETNTETTIDASTPPEEGDTIAVNSDGSVSTVPVASEKAPQSGTTEKGAPSNITNTRVNPGNTKDSQNSTDTTTQAESIKSSETIVTPASSETIVTPASPETHVYDDKGSEDLDQYVPIESSEAAPETEADTQQYNKEGEENL